jgi:hypothetical protein
MVLHLNLRRSSSFPIRDFRSRACASFFRNIRFKECEDTYHLDESRVVVDDRMVLMSMLNIANFEFVRANLMWSTCCSSI